MFVFEVLRPQSYIHYLFKATEELDEDKVFLKRQKADRKQFFPEITVC
jgi:hypothetical protein